MSQKVVVVAVKVSSRGMTQMWSKKYTVCRIVMRQALQRAMTLNRASMPMKAVAALICPVYCMLECGEKPRG
jgi:hypothetical protein